MHLDDKNGDMSSKCLQGIFVNGICDHGCKQHSGSCIAANGATAMVLVNVIMVHHCTVLKGRKYVHCVGINAAMLDGMICDHSALVVRLCILQGPKCVIQRVCGQLPNAKRLVIFLVKLIDGHLFVQHEHNQFVIQIGILLLAWKKVALSVLH